MRILKLEEIDAQVSECNGTWVERSNLRKKLMKERFELISFVISQINDEIRRGKSFGMTEKDLRPMYSFKSKMEGML